MSNYKPKNNIYKFRVYLGNLKFYKPERVYLTGFSWDCDWYWGGGYIETRTMHTHFNTCFLDAIDARGHSLGNFVTPWNYSKHKDNSITISNGCSVWENLDKFLDNARFTSNEWWRIKDLYKQFYTYRNASEVFQYGGGCTNEKRNQDEINIIMAGKINKHIEMVIIPEIIKALKL